MCQRPHARAHWKVLLEQKQHSADMLLEAEFEATEELGKSEVRLDRQFDAVTCMFAIHYFFASEKSLDNFFHNVSLNLRDGEVLSETSNILACGVLRTTPRKRK